jgi:hypothetical protein
MRYPLIRTGGGAKYFLTYGVAVAMTEQFMAISYSVQSSASKQASKQVTVYGCLRCTARFLIEGLGALG